MKPSVRAAVAAIACAHSGNKNVSSVYSHAESNRRTITVTVNAGSVTSYDHENSCHINGRLPSLYHYGVGCHFTVSVSGHAVQIYDHGESSHFAFSA